MSGAPAPSRDGVVLLTGEARAAWSADPAPMEDRPATAGERAEPDEARVVQAAVRAHVLVLTESIRQELATPGGASTEAE